MKSMLHSYERMHPSIQAQVKELYTFTFPGSSELNADFLPMKEVYVALFKGSFAAFVVFDGPVLLYIAVVSSDRGRGTGTMILRAGMDMCRSKDYTRMFLECSPSLIGYYQRFGGYELNPGKITYYDGAPYHRLAIDMM